MIRVKICGLTNLEDARWAWECGANLLGFVFVPSSPRQIAPERARRIVKALVAEGCGARFVGVFAGEQLAAVRRIAGRVGLDLVQLHGGEGPEYTRALGLPAIVAHRVRDVVPWDELAGHEAWGYLLDGYDPRQLGGSGRPWRWELLGQRPAGLGRLIVAGGLTPENVGEAVERTRPWGVDVSSGVERAPGCKDPILVRRFIERARAGAAGSAWASDEESP